MLPLLRNSAILGGEKLHYGFALSLKSDIDYLINASSDVILCVCCNGACRETKKSQNKFHLHGFLMCSHMHVHVSCNNCELFIDHTFIARAPARACEAITDESMYTCDVATGALAT